MDSWITDTGPWDRFPFYTRANADEVGPDPFSPLGWSLVWVRGTGPGAAAGFVAIGSVSAEEMQPRNNIFANYGGYFYNNLSLSRVFGSRLPGGSPEAIDRAYFGDHPGVPAYDPDPRDVNPARTEALTETVSWVLGAETYPRMEDAIRLSHVMAGNRPVLADLSDVELVAYARQVADRVHDLWLPYCVVVLAASFGPGAVSAICQQVGRQDATVPLFAALGGVESAGSSVAIWGLSRLVRRSTRLTAAFDAGATDLLARLRADPAMEVVRFVEDLDRLLDEHGHRGPNEWDIASDSWQTEPELVLGMIAQVRAQDDDHDPVFAARLAARVREEATEEIAGLLADDEVALSTFRSGLRSGTVFYQLREAGKSATIRVYHEVRLAVRELAHRAVERGHVDDVRQVFQLLDAELDAFVIDPVSWGARLRQRQHDFDLLRHLEPPYIVDSRTGPPPIQDWSPRGGSAVVPAAAGEVLRGAPASPGHASGRVRVVFDPASAEIQPGDVLVCRTTDPSWSPLFMACSAVICNVGAIGSHAAIVARELGVPCVVSLVDATSRIPDGAMVEVDGTAGFVRIVSM